MKLTRKGWTWQVVDRWIIANGDAEGDRERERMRAQMKRRHPLAQVRTYERAVKAGGVTCPVIAVVARVKVPMCTCTYRDCERPANLGGPCAYCERQATDG